MTTPTPPASPTTEAFTVTPNFANEMCSVCNSRLVQLSFTGDEPDQTGSIPCARFCFPCGSVRLVALVKKQAAALAAVRARTAELEREVEKLSDANDELALTVAEFGMNARARKAKLAAQAEQIAGLTEAIWGEPSPDMSYEETRRQAVDHRVAFDADKPDPALAAEQIAGLRQALETAGNDIEASKVCTAAGGYYHSCSALERVSAEIRAALAAAPAPEPDAAAIIDFIRHEYVRDFNVEWRDDLCAKIATLRAPEPDAKDRRIGDEPQADYEDWKPHL